MNMVYQYYDNQKSVDLCQKYFENPKDDALLYECFESVLPILGIIVRNHFKTLQDDDLDDLIQMGSLEFWRFLSESDPKPRPFSKTAHFNLYYKVGIRAMLKAINQNKSYLIDFHANNALPPVASWNFKNPEQELYVNELPGTIYEMVTNKIKEKDRFTGDEFAVCDYIAHCIIFRNEIQRFQIRKIGGKITNTDFFISYVEMLVKDVIIELRETTDITDLLTDEGISLNAVYYMTDDGPRDRFRE